MKNDKLSKILFIFFYVLAMISFVLNIVLGCALMVERDKAYADYNDLVNDTNAIVNFNQLINIESVGNNMSYNSTCVFVLETDVGSYRNVNISDFTFVNTHYYYIKSNNTQQNLMSFTNGGSIVEYINGDSIFHYSNNSLNITDIYLDSGFVAGTYYVNVIDLTQMFGSDENLPTLSQCQELFISEYYAYNTGTAMPLNSINSYELGYQNGFNDAWASQDITYRQNLINMSSFPYNFGTYNLSQKYYSDIEQAYGFRGYLGVPLYTLDAGTNISLDFTFLCSFWQGESLTFKQSYNLYVYVLDNSNLTLCATISYTDIDGNYGTYKGSFVLPIQTNTIYINFNDEPYDFTTTPPQVFVFESNATFHVNDIGLAVENAFNSGYNKAIERYSYGGDKYLEIYNAGVADAEQNGSVFQSSWDFIGSAFNGVGQLLAVELFPNVPIGIFVAFPLLLGLIFFIVKLTKGGS